MIKIIKYKKILSVILLVITLLSVAQPIFAVSGNNNFVGGQYASGMLTTDHKQGETGILIRRLINYDTGERYTVFCAEHKVDFDHKEKRLFQVSDMLTFIDKYDYKYKHKMKFTKGEKVFFTDNDMRRILKELSKKRF